MGEGPFGSESSRLTNRRGRVRCSRLDGRYPVPDELTSLPALPHGTPPSPQLAPSARAVPPPRPLHSPPVNLILLTEADCETGSQFRLTGRRAKHVIEVLRATPGKELRVGLLEGPLGTGRVVSAADGRVVLDCVFHPDPPPRPRTDLVLAIPRAKSLRKLLPEVTALGVDRIVLLRTWRVAKPYLSQTILRPESFRPLLHEGLMQARCTREPRVTVEPLFKPFVEDRLPALAAGAIALAAHPAAGTRIASVRPAAGERVVLAVGPEGGWVPYEVEALERAGFLPVSMGPRPVRVETACVALLAQIDVLRAAPRRSS